MMYSTSLYFEIKATHDKKVILEMFFKDWADSICNNEVAYSTTATESMGYGITNEVIQVDFVNYEDALIMKLRGVPDEFKAYLELLD